MLCEVELGVENVHLHSGEDYIGITRYCPPDGEGNAAHLVIDNPVIPNIGMSNGGEKMTIGLLPLRPYLKEQRVRLPMTSVAWHEPVNDRMDKGYRQFVSNITIVGSGIVTPDAPFIR